MLLDLHARDTYASSLLICTLAVIVAVRLVAVRYQQHRAAPQRSLAAASTTVTASAAAFATPRNAKAPTRRRTPIRQARATAPPCTILLNRLRA
jgi:hypothetical protein